MTDQQRPAKTDVGTTSTTNVDTNMEYKEELAMAVNVVAERLEAALLADLEDQRNIRSRRDQGGNILGRPRRVDALLHGLFEFIDSLSGKEERLGEVEVLDEKNEKGKGLETVRELGRPD